MPAALFDLDGTLIDTYDAHHVAWRSACAKHDIDLTPEMFAWSFGRTNPAIIARLWPDHGFAMPDEAAMTAIADEKEADFRAELERHFPAMSGVPELLRDLRDAGWKIAIGTSAPQENLDLAIERLGIADLVDATVCGTEVTHGKPDPEVFLKAAERTDTQPSECVVVEDAGAGIDAGKAGGMRTIGLVSTGRTHDELAHADLVVERFDQLTLQHFTALVGP
jgi:beta-phosphoglucomutase